ncbi:MAG: N-6 DNA methylase [Muribaculaceae bacterium]|nr:N-6 DNA methylase [Muribaculaceae bacterium]
MKQINSNIKGGRKEVITDNIVRDHFIQYEIDVIIEQQSSSNPSIDKLLRHASKQGGGKGYPDFIIQFKKDANFIIVIENKADKRYHESEDKKHYADFAVDGVLLYASFLSKSFDVLAIAISGVNKGDLKISHFLHLKNEPKAFPYFRDQLLSPIDYYNGLNNSEEKKRQDYDKLLDYTRVLNTRLHTMKIDEAERCILASCILLALRQPKFKNYYKLEDNQQILANNMVNDVLDWFKKEKVGDKKIEVLKSKYATVRGMFSDDSKDLRGLIVDMEENIDNFKKTNRYYDVLGQLYIAFLRYANTSNDLGVVLTPTHITEFFADVADVNKNSIVFDNCTGTCGFLIAAMSKMIDDAKGDRSIIESIKRDQLIGIEYADKMYCLAASNMAIHGDGKTNIYFDNGLNPVIIEEVKQRQNEGKYLRPTVGMLNPPYKADKKKDVEELEFVKWNLEALVEGGICVAIVPMQCAISTNGKIGALKKELLQKHTLEAVFSMPEELFYNSDKSVVTCVMVFSAHKPHQKDKETFFGYFKNDGFEKRKRLGRIDVHGNWKDIKREWLYLYKNRKEVEGKSVMRHVSSSDEWCAEAYMKTQYNSISKSQFEKTVRDYIAFKIAYNMNTSSIKYLPDVSESIPLSAGEWKWFEISEIFEKIYKGKAYNAQDLTFNSTFTASSVLYVTRTDVNNGVKGCVENDNFANYEKGNAITIGDTTATVYYQENDFICGDHIVVLRSSYLNKLRAMFIVSVINMERFRYCYGRAFIMSTIRRTKIRLPVDCNGRPDWEFMEKFIKTLPYSADL